MIDDSFSKTDFSETDQDDDDYSDSAGPRLLAEILATLANPAGDHCKVTTAPTQSKIPEVDELLKRAEIEVLLRRLAIFEGTKLRETRVSEDHYDGQHAFSEFLSPSANTGDFQLPPAWPKPAEVAPAPRVAQQSYPLEGNFQLPPASPLAEVAPELRVAQQSCPLEGDYQLPPASPLADPAVVELLRGIPQRLAQRRGLGLVPLATSSDPDAIPLPTATPRRSELAPPPVEVKIPLSTLGDVEEWKKLAALLAAKSSTKK